MRFKEWLLLTEMGRWTGRDEQGHYSHQRVPLPQLPQQMLRAIRPEGGARIQPGEVYQLDMRFEDYGLRAGDFANWYAVFQDGSVLYNAAMTGSQGIASAGDWPRLKTELEQGKNIKWVEVPSAPTPSEYAKEEHGYDSNPHPWWDYAEGLDDGGNTITKPSLYMYFRSIRSQGGQAGEEPQNQGPQEPRNQQRQAG